MNDFVYTSGSTSSEVQRAAGPWEETSHRDAEDEGHGQEDAGGGAEEGDWEVWAGEERGDHRQEQGERPAPDQPEEEQPEQHRICIWKLRAEDDGAESGQR